MYRRRLLCLAGVALAGCSGPETPTPGTEGTGTRTGTVSGTATATGSPSASDTAAKAEAAAALDRARAALSEATTPLLVEPTPLDADPIPDAAAVYDVDASVVTGGVERARTALDEARPVATEAQSREVKGYAAYADALVACRDLYGALVTLGEAVTTAESQLESGAYADVTTTLSGTASAGTTATDAGATASARLDASATVAETAGLPVGGLRDVLAVARPLGTALAALRTGHAGLAAGYVTTNEGETAFLDDEYERAITVFGRAITRFDGAVEAYATVDDAPAATGHWRPWRCQARDYRTVANQFQSAALEAAAGNTSQAFDEFRAARRDRRQVPSNCTF